MSYLLDFAGRQIPQTEQAKPNQVKNNAGGYIYQVDQWKQLERFLILGTEGGTYYVGERDITKENVNNVRTCIHDDGPRTVRTIVDISSAGRSSNNDSAIYALALAAKLGNEQTRKNANDAIPLVCRTGTHLYHYCNFVNQIGGWGRGTKRGVANWFNSKKVDDLAYQMVKYQSRDGFSSRDVLRLCHAKPADDGHDVVYRWITGNPVGDGVLPDIIEAFEHVKVAETEAEVIHAIHDFNLPREAIPTKWLTNPKVWAALAERMPITATIRNLATMTRIGLLTDDSKLTEVICNRVRDERQLSQGRVHPLQILTAMLTYKAGHGIKSDTTWKPISRIVDSLDAAFYSSFKVVAPTGKHHVLALDISGSMWSGQCGGVIGLTPALGACAMALITASVERRFTVAGFGTVYQGLDISPRRRLDDNLKAITGFNFGGTDCALSMIHAKRNKADVDIFCVYTDSETWQGKVHADVALEDYRQACGHDAKLVVIGMVGNKFTIANPNDPGMLDVVGFDSATPQVISEFAKG